MERPEVQYLVLPDADNPALLARVRWPDVCQAMSHGRPIWQEDLGLFDLPYAPTSTAVTVEQAIAIAAGWGVRLDPNEPPKSEVALMRRMPPDWTELSPAERRAWSLDAAGAGTGGKKRRGAQAEPPRSGGTNGASHNGSAATANATEPPPGPHRRWLRRRAVPTPAGHPGPGTGASGSGVGKEDTMLVDRLSIEPTVDGVGSGASGPTVDLIDVRSAHPGPVSVVDGTGPA
jgi:hypothetical protein